MAIPGNTVYFDRILFDDVVVALVPVDAFTGETLAGALRVSIEKQIGANLRRLPDKPVRNATGMYVFLNRRNEPPLASPAPLPAPPFQLAVEAEDAGYFDPAPVQVNAIPNDRRIVVTLHRRPGAKLDSATTSVDGVVVNGPARVDGATIRAIFPPASLPPNAQPQPFETRSDARGAFSLRMRLPASSVNVRIEVSQNGPPLSFNRVLEEGVAYAFERPIDLQPNAPTNQPLVELPP